MRNRRAILFFLFWGLVFSVGLLSLSFFGDRDSVRPDRTLSEFDVRDVTRIVIERRGDDGKGERLSLGRVDGGWRIEEPLVAEADEERVKGLIDTVVFSEPVDALSEKDMAAMGRSFRDFGLSVPRAAVTVCAGNSSETFLIGKRTAAGDEVYVARAAAGGVVTVPSRIADETLRPLVGFRRRRLFTFRPADVVGLGLKDQGEPLTRLVKTGTAWRIANPVDAPADLGTVSELIDVLCSAGVEDYVADAGTGHRLGADEGFTVSLRDTFGAVEKAVFGAHDGTNLVWALTSEGAAVHVRKEVLDLCRSRQKTLEDTRIFPLEAPAVLTMSVSRGFPAYVVSRKSSKDEWSMVSPVDAAVDAAVAGRLLANILSLKGADLVREDAEDAVQVSAATAAVNCPPRYVSSAALMRGVRFVDLLDRTVVRAARGQVRAVKVKSAAGDRWNAVSSEETLSLLEAGVRAERVERVALTPEDFERFGFGHPSYTVEFEFDDTGSSMKKMLIGAVAPGGGRYAVIGGLDAAFVLPSSAVSVLVKPVDASKEGVK